ncbi:hypothetical protein KC315_g14667 [Hortaea werneckii]|nr:hypothetical protein KC315_g14667 [Hortaea werneckii]
MQTAHYQPPYPHAGPPNGYPPMHAYPGYPPAAMADPRLPPPIPFSHHLGPSNKRLAPVQPHPAESPAKKKQSKWTAEEDASIIELRGGNMKWEDISKHLPGRSAISCRLRFQNYLERRSEWDEEKKNKLARLYERFKKDMWEKIAKEMQLPWRAAEAMHWQIGEVEMAQRANVPVFHLAGGGNASGPPPPGASLLQWVQSFEELGKVEGWLELSDGKRLWMILREVDSGYFSGGLPEPEVPSSGDWTRKWQNLKHLERQVSTYYRDVCGGQDSIAAGHDPALKTIAAEASVPELEKLIMVIIRAAMASPESNQRMAQRLMSLGRENAMVIANELRAMEESEVVDSEPMSRDESAYQSEQETSEETKSNGNKAKPAPYTDPLLEREEELLQAQATIDKLQASQAAAQRQLHELRQDKERLQEAFDAYRSDIDVKGRKSGGDDAFKKLQRQADNDRAYIDDLESQMQSSRSTMESYERQIEKFKADNEASQKLRDDLQMLKADNEDLGQKVKANENLKKKIQTLQEQEKMNASLKEELKTANDRLEELDRLKLVQSSLEKEIIEKKGLIRNQEYQINELTTTRKHAEYDARMLMQKLDAARERAERDHEALEDLRSKLQESRLDDPDIDDAPTKRDQELTDAEQQPQTVSAPTDDSKHWREKLAMVEKQLEAADARLKQAAERNAALEDASRSRDTDTEAQQEADKQAAEREQLIADLRSQVEASKKDSSKEPAPAQDTAALQRENRLMASAWYDLASRLQNNGVSLGRRRQEPKSWLGKQRALVGPSNSLQR